MTTTYERPPTPAEYLVRERAAAYKSEYYGGEVVAMGGASRAHDRITTALLVSLVGQLRGRPCEVFSSDVRVRIREASAYVYPDLSVVCGEAQWADRELDMLLNPTVVLEVLSPSTERIDRGRKADAYHRLDSLREYVLLAQEAPRAEVYRREPDGTWGCQIVLGLDGTLELASIGCTLPMAEVYERVFGPAARA
jgi:Uma2 family endonuclease